MIITIDRILLLFLIPLSLLPGMLCAYWLKGKLFAAYAVSKQPLFVLLLGLLVNLLVAGLLLALPVGLSRYLRYGYFLVGISLSVILFIKHKVWQKVKPDWALLLLAIGLVLAHGYFTSHQVFPANTDSISHYRYIDQFLNWQSTGQTFFDFVGRLRFYHYGFHLLVADLHLLSGIAITEVMLVLGMYLAVLAPFSLIPLLEALGIDRKIRNIAVGVIALVVLFPGLALNWGKYPAMLSAVLLGLPSALVIEMMQMDFHKVKAKALIGLGGIMLLLGLCHWRAWLVLMVLVLIAWLHFKVMRQRAPWWVLLPFTVNAIVFLMTDRLRFNTPRQYLVFWVAALTLGVFLLAWTFFRGKKTQLAFALLAWLALRALAAFNIPWDWFQSSLLIDMPYYRIVLFMFGGIFLALCLQALETFIQELNITKPQALWLRDGLLLVGLFLVLIAIPFKQKWLPSASTMLVETGHKEAIDWALANLQSSKSKVLIAGRLERNYVEFADAGGWLVEMGHYDHDFVVSRMDFASAASHSLLCDRGIDGFFVDYKSPTVFGFDAVIDPEKYEILFQNNTVKVIAPKCENH